MRDGILLVCILLGLYLVFAVYIALENKFNNDQIETLNEKVERLEEKLKTNKDKQKEEIYKRK